MAVFRYFTNIDIRSYVLLDNYPENTLEVSAQPPRDFSWFSGRINGNTATFRGDFEWFFDSRYGDDSVAGDLETLTITRSGTKLFEATRLDVDVYNFDDAGQDDGATVALNILFAGNDRLIGSRAADSLDGRGGNDVILGNAGHDALRGGAGSDVLDGGRGTDTLTGGIGADRFVFKAVADSANGSRRDVVVDFTDADWIDLRGVDANANRAGDQAFRFIGSESFGDRAGELRFANGVVQGDVNGDGRTDFAISVEANGSPRGQMAADDFLL